MARKCAWLAVLACALWCQACTHQVAFQKPQLALHPDKIPLDVSFFMREAVRSQTYEGRAWSSGIANTWIVPVGEVAYEYALAELSDAFFSFQETTAAASPVDRYSIEVSDLQYRMEGQAAHATATLTVRSPGAEKVMEETYSEDGPSGYGRVLAGGVFTQKSAIRQSSHVVFESIFRRFLKDVRTRYARWVR